MRDVSLLCFYFARKRFNDVPMIVIADINDYREKL